MTYAPLRLDVDAPDPTPGIGSQPYVDNIPPGRHNSWTIVGAIGVLTLAALAAVLAATGLTQEPASAQHTVNVVPAQELRFPAAQVAAAKVAACTAWDSAATTIAASSRAVSAIEPGWDNPDRIRARQVESRTALTQTAYLNSQVDRAAPREVRMLIAQYNELTMAQQNASIHQRGKTLDALIRQQNDVVDKLEAACR
ncbi:hypothetical protein [Mycobacteroides abscessus]|uniref:hypothetical protein n=1 Tax=Mycobacteroides abscessus TaxID=36809 RepID=UPI0003869F0E|nr:hypothetical protein [Mycobacteroides abscessus]EPZ18776.1 hypothetical protein M879_19410 [Mycobacteroides abscessus V06705]MDO3268007.1 hypothetical protein [Mycobacteroides abscessus subsp. abscessus]